MKKDKNEILKAFGDLLDVVEELRQKCPWDRKQTNESLRCNTIEEVYELSAALMADDADNITLLYFEIYILQRPHKV